MSHVIAAISTGMTVSAIGILRLTGDGCAQVAGKVFKLSNGAALEDAPNRKLVLGNLQDKQGRIIDSCLYPWSSQLYRRGYRGNSMSWLACCAGRRIGGAVRRRRAACQTG